jgi:hypothetical protein
LDIHGFIDQQLQKHPLLKGDNMRDFKHQIMRKVGSDSKGMFQWANLQVKEILRCETHDALEDYSENLEQLPTDLEMTYDYIYNTQIRHRKDRDIVDRAIMWVMTALDSEALTTDELLDAVRLSLSEDPDQVTLKAPRGRLTRKHCWVYAGASSTGFHSGRGGPMDTLSLAPMGLEETISVGGSLRTLRSWSSLRQNTGPQEQVQKRSSQRYACYI